MIYLDNAATTYPKPECVYAEMDDANRNLAVNAGRGTYKAAKAATDLINETRGRVSSLFNADGVGNVVFTPSVTHALNQVIGGLDLTENTVVYLTPYEHNAVARAVHLQEEKVKFTTKMIPLSKDLAIDMDRTEFEFSKDSPDVVIINVMSNVTGYCLPYLDLTKRAKAYGATVILDVAQAAGVINIDFRESSADILCFAGHKSLYGPFGIGGFIIRDGISLKNTVAGGTGSNSLNLEMPSDPPGRYEMSSMNIPAFAGLNAALKVMNLEEHHNKIKELTQYLRGQLVQIPKVHLLGDMEEQTLGNISFIVEGYDSADVGMILDEEYDIAVRTGFHCAPYIHAHVNDKAYGGTVRAGLGIFNNKEEIDKLVEAIKSL